MTDKKYDEWIEYPVGTDGSYKLGIGPKLAKIIGLDRTDWPSMEPVNPDYAPYYTEKFEFVVPPLDEELKNESVSKLVKTIIELREKNKELTARLDDKIKENESLLEKMTQSEIEMEEKSPKLNVKFAIYTIPTMRNSKTEAK